MDDGGQLDEHVRPPLKLSQRIVVRLSRLSCRLQAGQVIQHHAKVRDLIRDSNDRLQQGDTRVRRVENEIRLLQQFQSADERGILRLLRDVPSPEIAISNPTKEPVLVIALEHLREVRLVWLEVAAGADDAGV